MIKDIEIRQQLEPVEKSAIEEVSVRQDFV